MSKIKKRSIYKKLTTKEIAVLSEVSLRTADRIKTAIKREFNISKVYYKDYCKYYLDN